MENTRVPSCHQISKWKMRNYHCWALSVQWYLFFDGIPLLSMQREDLLTEQPFKRSKQCLGLHEVPNIPIGLCSLAPPGTQDSEVLVTLMSLCFGSFSRKYLLISQLCCKTNVCLQSTRMLLWWTPRSKINTYFIRVIMLMGNKLHFGHRFGWKKKKSNVRSGGCFPSVGIAASLPGVEGAFVQCSLMQLMLPHNM